MRYHVYGIGAALVDTEIEVEDADLTRLGISKGHMTLVDVQRQQELLNYLASHLLLSKRTSGGSGANSIIAASHFGARTFYSCKVANDDNGRFYLKDMKDAGVDCNAQDKHIDACTCSGFCTCTDVTGKCLVLITPDAERSMLTHLGISETIANAALDMDAAKNAQFVYIEGYLVTSKTGRAAAIALYSHAKKHGVNTAISLSDPSMVEFFGEGLREMIGEGVDLLFCNEDEAQKFTGTNNIDAAAQALKAYAKTFAITCGARGARVYDGQNTHHIAPYVVAAIDSNGAGDMFAGAFLYAITHGYSYADAGRLASRASAEVVKNYGPRLPAEKHRELLQEVFSSAVSV